MISILSLYKCPLYGFFGIPCPLCGTTRALLAMLSGDIKNAFYYHPLWPLTIIALLVILLSQLRILNLGNKTINILAFILAFIYLFTFIIRHVLHSPIVEIHLSDGLLFKILNIP